MKRSYSLKEIAESEKVKSQIQDPFDKEYEDNQSLYEFYTGKKEVELYKDKSYRPYFESDGTICYNDDPYWF